ncbi:asparagine synthase, partial [Streptomyces rubellomurinus subsp. indigoferus]
VNTFLICSAAREGGVEVMLQGMGPDEVFAGYRKHLANWLALRSQRVARPLRRALSAAVDRLPVATSRRGLRSVGFAKRFLSLAHLPEETPCRRRSPRYDPAELRVWVDPPRPGTVAE